MLSLRLVLPISDLRTYTREIESPVCPRPGDEINLVVKPWPIPTAQVVHVTWTDLAAGKARVLLERTQPQTAEEWHDDLLKGGWRPSD
jgi:hypothetical protein